MSTLSSGAECAASPFKLDLARADALSTRRSRVPQLFLASGSPPSVGDLAVVEITISANIDQ
jgi:hypothetical protein